jgi:hypothetical protein
LKINTAVVTKIVGCSMLTKKMERGKEIMTLDIKQNKRREGDKISIMKRPRFLPCQTK